MIRNSLAGPFKSLFNVLRRGGNDAGGLPILNLGAPVNPNDAARLADVGPDAPQSMQAAYDGGPNIAAPGVMTWDFASLGAFVCLNLTSFTLTRGGVAGSGAFFATGWNSITLNGGPFGFSAAGYSDHILNGIGVGSFQANGHTIFTATGTGGGDWIASGYVNRNISGSADGTFSASGYSAHTLAGSDGLGTFDCSNHANFAGNASPENATGTCSITGYGNTNIGGGVLTLIAGAGVSCTWPSTAGAADSYLRNNGAGSTSWVNPQAESDLGTTSGEFAVNFTTLGVRNVLVTLDGDAEITAITMGIGNYQIRVVNTGAFTLIWPTGIEWAGGTPPVATPSGRSVVNIFSANGETWAQFGANFG